MPGVAGSGDAFGAACRLPDVDGDGHRDLMGAVWALPGTGTGTGTGTGKREGLDAFGPQHLAAPATKALLGASLR